MEGNSNTRSPAAPFRSSWSLRQRLHTFRQSGACTPYNGRQLRSRWPCGARDSVNRLKPPRPCSGRSEEHTSELQSRLHLVCRLLLEKKKNTNTSQESSTDV